MKAIHIILIASILFLWLGVAHSTPMSPEFDPGLTFEWPATFDTIFTPIYVSTYHYKWKYDPDLSYDQVGRLMAFERFLYEVERRQPVATPEPGTCLLLGSGIIGILVIRRKGYAKNHKPISTQL